MHQFGPLAAAPALLPAAVIVPLLVLIVLEKLHREPVRGLHLCLAQETLGEQSPSWFFMSLIGDLQTLQ